MRLYIMRHGQAEPGGRCPDSERSLTANGNDELNLVGEGLRALGVEVELVAHSPLVRTTQTAEIISTFLGEKAELLRVGSLAPGARPEIIFKEVMGLSEFNALMTVGHAPDVSIFSHYALAGEHGSAFNFLPGSVACIEFDGGVSPGRGKLVWFMTPSEFQNLVAG